MRRLVRISILIGCGIGLVAGAVTYRHESERAYPPPNILILSLCSLRKAELDPALNPNIDRAFRSGLKLQNVYSNFGWVNLAPFFRRDLDARFFADHGYDVIGDGVDSLQLSVRAGSPEADADETVHQVYPKLQYLRSRLSLHRPRPFFAFAHIKYMHYPYIDRFNPDSGWDRFLSAEEKAHVERVLQATELPEERLPFALTLYPRRPDPATQFFALYNLMVDKTTLGRWSAGPEYPMELEILRKVYRAKLRKMDEILAPVLDLYGNPELKENTIVILMGDHGEAFMEHGHLGHAMHVYDEILTPPVLVRFPRIWRLAPEERAEQVYMGSLVDWIRAAVQGRHQESDFRRAVLQNPKNEIIVSRNCSNNVHSVRWDGRWKLIVDRAAREKMLFDLKTDPKETVNVIDGHLDVAARLELELAARLGEMNVVTDPTPCRLN